MFTSLTKSEDAHAGQPRKVPTKQLGWIEGCFFMLGLWLGLVALAKFGSCCQQMFHQHMNSNLGGLSSLSELRLEQLFFVVTGLSPRLCCKDLIVKTKSDLFPGCKGWHAIEGVLVF